MHLLKYIQLLLHTRVWAVFHHGSVDVDVIFVDFSCAFDSVVHSKLIYKLTYYGIFGCLLTWINAFLFVSMRIN